MLGCGSSGDAGPLGWSERPQQFPGPSETEFIVQGEVENTSLRPLRIEAADVRIVDAAGDSLPGQAVFLAGFARPIEPQNRGPVPETDFERERLGKVVVIRPGESAPLNVAWRDEPGAGARVQYPGGALELPTR